MYPASAAPPPRALIRADHPSPEAALAGLVGPLAMFRWEAASPPAETAEQAAAAAHPAPAPSLSPADDFTDPRTWDLPDAADVTVAPVVDAAPRSPATDVIVGSGEPPSFTFRGQGQPGVHTVEVVVSCGGKVTIVETGVVPVPPVVPPVVPAVLGYGHEVTKAETQAPPSADGALEAAPGRVRKVAS